MVATVDLHPALVIASFILVAWFVHCMTRRRGHS